MPDATAHAVARPGAAAGPDSGQAEPLRLLAARAYDVCGEPLDADLDGIVALAAHLAGTATAAVHVVADGQTFRQLAVSGGARGAVLRGEAPCEGVVTTGEPLQVPDASADARWSGSPYVDGRLGAVRLYAGAPLRTPGGHVIGTLCVLDDRPGELSTSQIGALGLLADQAVALLEARRLSRTLSAALADLDRVAHLDSLTGLANRGAGVRALQRISAAGGWGLLFVDVDDLKALNDRYGHDAGDACLTEIARRMQSALRPHDLLVRWGGDEFVVLLADVHDLDGVRAAAARLRASVGAPYDSDGRELVLSVSIGGQVVHRDADAGLLLRHADTEMYADKRRRKGVPAGG